MKTTFKVMFGAVVLGMIALNVVSFNANGTDGTTLKNLAALQSSAGEMYCDQKNEVRCEISQGGATGVSKGYLRVNFPDSFN